VPLADADHSCADLGQRAHEVSLRRRKRRLDEDNVHDRMLPGFPPAAARRRRRRYGPDVVVAAFVAPFLLDATARFVATAAQVPERFASDRHLYAG